MKAFTMTKRTIVDARADKDGDISHVKLDGNKIFTPISKVIPMADQGKIENAHAVHPTDGRADHLRTNPDGKQTNNLDDMAGDN